MFHRFCHFFRCQNHFRPLTDVFKCKNVSCVKGYTCTGGVLPAVVTGAVLTADFAKARFAFRWHSPLHHYFFFLTLQTAAHKSVIYWSRRLVAGACSICEILFLYNYWKDIYSKMQFSFVMFEGYLFDRENKTISTRQINEALSLIHEHP